MSREFDIIVVGAGIAGASLAALLALRKTFDPARIALVSAGVATPGTPAVKADIDLRVFAMSRASQRLLQEIDVWQGLDRERCCAYQRMRIWDSRDAPDSTAVLCFDAADLGEPDLGTIVENRALQSLSLAAARRAGVALIDARVESASVTEREASLRLGDGRELRAALVIAADGADSALRTLFGIDPSGHSYHQNAIVAHVRTGRPHQDTAWQCFLPAGPLAFLPLKDGRSSIVWSADADRSRALLEMEPGVFNAELTRASGGALGEVELTSERASFALRLQYAAEYVKPRFALLGDAAHTVHPLAGQGLNLGLKDVAALADLLRDSPGAPIGELRFLRRYERERKSDNLIAATAFDGLNRLFSNDDPWLSRLRSVGLGVVGRTPALQRLFARRALG